MRLHLQLLNKCKQMQGMIQKNAISRLLPYGSITDIAQQLGLSTSATSQAIRRGNPGHPAVQEAVRRTQGSLTSATAQALEILRLS